MSEKNNTTPELLLTVNLLDLVSMLAAQGVIADALSGFQKNNKPDNLTCISKLELTCRSHNCLKSDGVLYVEDLCRLRAYEVLRIPNLGRKSLREIEEVLADFGLNLQGRA